MSLLPLTLVLAVADDGTIGHAGGIPWRAPEDMQRFKAATMGHAVIMGRKTWESLPDAARPLPGRRNIVVSATMRYDDFVEDAPYPAQIWATLDAALYTARFTDAEPMVIGGAQLYRTALPLATKILLTEVHLAPAGDTRFELDRAGWTETRREHGVDERREFVTLERA